VAGSSAVLQRSWLPPTHHCGEGRGTGTLTEQRQGGQGWSFCHFCTLPLSLTSAVYSSVLKMETESSCVRNAGNSPPLHRAHTAVSHSCMRCPLNTYLLRQDMGHSKCNKSQKTYTTKGPIIYSQMFTSLQY
jgi:hypothetical protein